MEVNERDLLHQMICTTRAFNIFIDLERALVGHVHFEQVKSRAKNARYADKQKSRTKQVTKSHFVSHSTIRFDLLFASDLPSLRVRARACVCVCVCIFEQANTRIRRPIALFHFVCGQ